MNQRLSVNYHYVRAIQETAQRLGLTLPAASDLKPDERVDLPFQDRIWQQLWAATDDPMIGIELGMSVEIGHMDTTGLLATTCDTVGEALDTLIEYLPIIAAGSYYDLRKRGHICYMSYEPVYDVCLAPRVEAALTSLLNLLRWGTKGRFRAQHLTLRHAPLVAPEHYRKKLDLPIEFHAADNALVFHDDNLALPEVHRNKELSQHLRVLADETMAQLGEYTLSAQVKAYIRRQPRWGRKLIANKLGISDRHLVRKLAAEGTSYKLLHNQFLRGHAEAALRRGSTIVDISKKLGYADHSAFTKAFKRWTGKTPTDFTASLESSTKHPISSQ